MEPWQPSCLTPPGIVQFGKHILTVGSHAAHHQEGTGRAVSRHCCCAEAGGPQGCSHRRRTRASSSSLPAALSAALGASGEAAWLCRRTVRVLRGYTTHPVKPWACCRADLQTDGRRGVPASCGRDVGREDGEEWESHTQNLPPAVWWWWPWVTCHLHAPLNCDST